MKKLMASVFAFSLASVLSGQTPTPPVEIDTRTVPPPKVEHTVVRSQPLFMLNLNINIGNQFAPTPSVSSKVKAETLSLHILKLEKHGDIFRAFVEDEDGNSEWKKIPVEGLKYHDSDDVAWYYRESDVLANGKVTDKERVMWIHHSYFLAVVNSADGASF